MTTINSSLIALDVGEKRVGVAIASLQVRLPRPLVTLSRDDGLFGRLAGIIKDESVTDIIVGLPRGLDGQNTPQTSLTQVFADSLGERFNLPIHLQDEALTTKKAETELSKRRKSYTRGEVDALAATYILEDFLVQTTREVS